MAAAPTRLRRWSDRLRRWPALSVLVGWTVFLWLSRLRNVVADDDLSRVALTWRIVVVGIFVSLAVLAGLRSTRRWAVPALVWWTIGFWLVRGGGILLDDHDLSFTVVHTVLMAVSIATAMWVWRTRSR